MHFALTRLAASCPLLTAYCLLHTVSFGLLPCSPWSVVALRYALSALLFPRLRESAVNKWGPLPFPRCSLLSPHYSVLTSALPFALCSFSIAFVLC